MLTCIVYIIHINNVFILCISVHLSLHSLLWLMIKLEKPLSPMKKIYFLLLISQSFVILLTWNCGSNLFLTSKEREDISPLLSSAWISPKKYHHLLCRDDELQSIQLRCACQCWFNKSTLEIKLWIFQNIKQQRNTWRKMREIENKNLRNIYLSW